MSMIDLCRGQRVANANMGIFPLDMHGESSKCLAQHCNQISQSKLLWYHPHFFRHSLGAQETRDCGTLKKIAEKEYHLTNQLDA